MKTQKVVSSIKDSEFKVSPTEGIQTKGVMSWVIIIMLFILLWKYIDNGKMKKHVDKTKDKVKRIFKRGK